MAEQHESQLASAVLMIRPARFESNPLTAASNRFQGRNADSPSVQQRDAATEFDALAAALEAAGIDVIVFPDTEEPHTPDAVFPNNWVSFHADGTVVTYPMLAPNRRTERRPDIIEALERDRDFHVRRVLDLSFHESTEQFLEGTGSLVLDRPNRVAYACLSPRTTRPALEDFAERMHYTVEAFEAFDRQGIAIYHTNVLMNVGEKLAVLCAEAIRDQAERQAVLSRLRASGHVVVQISLDQVDAFAGNMLELRNRSGERIIVMSAQAHRSLERVQIRTINSFAKIVNVPVERIERSAGGSVRCMLAEIHLPRGDRQPMGDPLHE
jgi:hypothetical protein